MQFWWLAHTIIPKSILGAFFVPRVPFTGMAHPFLRFRQKAWAVPMKAKNTKNSSSMSVIAGSCLRILIRSTSQAVKQSPYCYNASLLNPPT